MEYNFDFISLLPLFELRNLPVAPLYTFSEKEEVIDFLEKNKEKKYVLRAKDFVFVSNEDGNKDLIKEIDKIKKGFYYLQERVAGERVVILGRLKSGEFLYPALCYERRGFYILVPIKEKDIKLYKETLGKIEDFLPKTWCAFFGLRLVISEKKMWVVDTFCLEKELANFETLYLDEKRFDDVISLHKKLKLWKWI